MKRLLFLAILFGCSSNKPDLMTLDIQGHRGARGLYPENSIAGFIEAIKLGVTTLELDLVVSGDTQLVVSHEPFFSPDFCADSSGQRVGSVINIYQLTYEQIQAFDCGSLIHERFPEQKKMKTSKPLLSEVFDAVEEYILQNALPKVRYNIELKTTKETDDIFHPKPTVFADLVVGLITRYELWERVNIQSFDFRTLRYFNETYPEVKLALLIENSLEWEMNVDSLGFVPEIYSCYFELLTKKSVEEMQARGIKVIPWTVNEPAHIEKMIGWKVNGIISDYPNRVIEQIERLD